MDLGKIATVHPDFRCGSAAVPDGIRWWLLNRFCALEALRTLWVLPTTVLPFMPSLRDRLSNRRKDLLCYVAFAALRLSGGPRRNVMRLELAVMGK
jgi:hypothetical protein